MKRQPGIDLEKVLAKLEKTPEKLQSLYEMEQSGGKPDMIALKDVDKDFEKYEIPPY